ncbi:hypothetical protein ACT4R9_11600 [Ornithobacterium rhinotracheale]|uniref:hypothetical protein n=1 Tax=Ornithobacterium rhinotracheale TaxID=28251 RepID=UPI003FA451AB
MSDCAEILKNIEFLLKQKNSKDIMIINGMEFIRQYEFAYLTQFDYTKNCYIFDKGQVKTMSDFYNSIIDKIVDYEKFDELELNIVPMELLIPLDKKYQCIGLVRDLIKVDNERAYIDSEDYYVPLSVYKNNSKQDNGISSEFVFESDGRYLFYGYGLLLKSYVRNSSILPISNEP